MIAFFLSSEVSETQLFMLQTQMGVTDVQVFLSAEKSVTGFIFCIKKKSNNKNIIENKWLTKITSYFYLFL